MDNEGDRLKPGGSLFSHVRQRFRYPNARLRMLLATVFGVAGFFLLPDGLTPHTSILTAWDIGIVAFLLLAYTVILGASAEKTYSTASQQDQSSAVILVIVAGAASASLLAIGYLLSHAKGLPDFNRNVFLLVSALTILCSWFLTHTLFALHYAHRYYGGETEEPIGEINRGLSFPDSQQPTYLDFVYVAFVIGMTAQVSDVQVTTRSMRKLVLLHSILSFWFYAGILALAINLVSGLI